MKTIMTILFFLSFSTFAEVYQAPKLDKLEWKAKSNKLKSESDWASQHTPNDGEKEMKHDLQRKPSSGEEDKPKFWDFKSVK